MKAKTLMLLGIFFTISLSVILTAPLYARQSFGENCLSCHNQGGITLTLNATDGMKVNVSSVFTVQAEAQGDAPELTVIWSSVAGNPSFAFIPSSVVDNGANDLDPQTNTVRAAFQITAPTTQGDYMLQVFAAGGGANGATRTLQVNVTSPGTTPPTGNLLPTAYFLSARNGMTLIFEDRSSDPEGNITAWLWNFGDSTNSTEKNPTHVFEEFGTYIITLTVTDDKGGRSMHSQTVTVPPKEERAMLWDLQVFLGSLVIVFTVLFAVGIATITTKEEKKKV